MVVGLLFGISSCWSDCGHGDCWPAVFGEMTATPEQIPADGQTNAEVSVFLYLAWETCDIHDKPLTPVGGVAVMLESSRNTGGTVVDNIEQPTRPTDADGMAVAYIWSSTPGESQLRATQDGAIMCEGLEGKECVPLQVLVTFVE